MSLLKTWRVVFRKPGHPYAFEQEVRAYDTGSAKEKACKKLRRAWKDHAAWYVERIVCAEGLA